MTQPPTSFQPVPNQQPAYGQAWPVPAPQAALQAAPQFYAPQPGYPAQPPAGLREGCCSTLSRLSRGFLGFGGWKWNNFPP
jgi:hypothetical protein